MDRVRRPLLSSIALLMLMAPGWSGEPRLPLYGPRATLKATPIALDPGDPGRTRVGALHYLGGLHLTSDDPAFGGFSALSVTGSRFTLLSDGGLTLDFTMGPDLRPRQARFGVLPDGPGAGWLRGDRDSESLSVDPATGRMWVGFETVNAVWRYAPGFARAEASATPRAMRAWPQNGGAETMVRLTDGTFVILSESDRPRGQRDLRNAVRFDRDPTDPAARAVRFTYRPPPGYSPTDAAELPDGRLLVLSRDVSVTDLFTAKLAIVDPHGLQEGETLSGPEIASLAAPILHDNFEGMAVTREGSAVIVWLLSDDNGPSWFQRTLLLKFRLDRSPPETPKTRP